MCCARATRSRARTPASRGKLMKHLGASKPLWRYDDHASEDDRARLIESMRTRARRAGQRCGHAAGLGPRLSPGARGARGGDRGDHPAGPVRRGRRADAVGPAQRPLPVRRASCPPRTRRAATCWPNWRAVPATLVFYETAPRLAQVARGDRARCLPGPRGGGRARADQALRGMPQRLRPPSCPRTTPRIPPRGEIVLLVGPPDASAVSTEDPEALLSRALLDMKPSQAASQVAKATGLDRKALYARALELQADEAPARRARGPARRARRRAVPARQGLARSSRAAARPRWARSTWSRAARARSRSSRSNGASAPTSSAWRSTNTACAASPPRPRRWRTSTRARARTCGST